MFQSSNELVPSAIKSSACFNYQIVSMISRYPNRSNHLGVLRVCGMHTGGVKRKVQSLKHSMAAQDQIENHYRMRYCILCIRLYGAKITTVLEVLSWRGNNAIIRLNLQKRFGIITRGLPFWVLATTPVTTQEAIFNNNPAAPSTVSDTHKFLSSRSPSNNPTRLVISSISFRSRLLKDSERK